MAITPQDVADWLKLPAVDDVVELATAATVAFVDELPDAPRITEGDDAGEWTDATNLAAIMLAARLVRRRNSPSGVEALTEEGVSYVARYDSDIARLLRIDGYASPRVG